MISNGAQAADMIKVLSATLQAANLSSQVGIACCESEGWGNQVTMLNAIKSAGAESLLKAVTSHTYTGGSSSPMNHPCSHATPVAQSAICCQPGREAHGPI